MALKYNQKSQGDIQRSNMIKFELIFESPAEKDKILIKKLRNQGIDQKDCNKRSSGQAIQKSRADWGIIKEVNALNLKLL